MIPQQLIISSWSSSQNVGFMSLSIFNILPPTSVALWLVSIYAVGVLESKSLHAPLATLCKGYWVGGCGRNIFIASQKYNVKTVSLFAIQFTILNVFFSIDWNFMIFKISACSSTYRAWFDWRKVVDLVRRMYKKLTRFLSQGLRHLCIRKFSLWMISKSLFMSLCMCLSDRTTVWKWSNITCSSRLHQ